MNAKGLGSLIRIAAFLRPTLTPYVQNLYYRSKENVTNCDKPPCKSHQDVPKKRTFSFVISTQIFLMLVEDPP